MILLRFQGGMNLLGFAGGYEFTVTYKGVQRFIKPLLASSGRVRLLSYRSLTNT